MKSSVCLVFSAQPAGKGLELLSADHSLALRGDDRAASISSLSLVLYTSRVVTYTPGTSTLGRQVLGNLTPPPLQQASKPRPLGAKAP